MEFTIENIGIWTRNIILVLIFLRNILEVKRCTSNKTASLLIALSLIIFILLFPFIVIFFVIFILYYLVISLILKIEIGKKFNGLLNGSDSFHTINESTQSIIHCLIPVKCLTKRSPEDFFDSIKQILWKLHRHSKFKKNFYKKFGYSYMLNGDLSIDDCIKKLETINCKQKIIEKKDLLMLLNDYSNTPLPRNKTLGWEILVGTQPVNWNDDEYEYYPLLMRFNHAVTDGVMFMKLMVELGDKPDVNIKSISKIPSLNICDSSSSQILQEYVSNIFIGLYHRRQQLLELIIRSFYSLLLLPASVISNCIFKGNDCNILHKHLLSGEKILALDIEKSQKYVLKIKQIKNKIPGTRFSDVIITAFSASLTEYFEKNMAQPPQYATATVPVFNKALNIQRAIPGKFVTEKVKNGYSFYLMNLPITENKNLLLTRKLEMIRKESSNLRNSSDYYVNFFIMWFLNSILPHPVGRFILSRARWVTAFSVIPGYPKITYCDGSMVFCDMLMWVPHMHNVGTTFVINTHDNRLHMGFSVDKALIDNQDVAQTIVDGVYKYLDLLADEVESAYPDTK